MFWNMTPKTNPHPVFKVDTASFYETTIYLPVQQLLDGNITELNVSDEVKLLDLEGSIGFGQVVETDVANGIITVEVQKETVAHG